MKNSTLQHFWRLKKKHFISFHFTSHFFFHQLISLPLQRVNLFKFKSLSFVSSQINIFSHLRDLSFNFFNVLFHLRQVRQVRRIRQLRQVRQVRHRHLSFNFFFILLHFRMVSQAKLSYMKIRFESRFLLCFSLSLFLSFFLLFRHRRSKIEK